MVPTFAREGIWLFPFLFMVVLSRAQIDLLARREPQPLAPLRASGRSGFLGAIARWFEGPVPRRGAAMLDKWGIIVIPLCFLTVGIQTAVNAGAGLVRMRWSTYTIAMIPGVHPVGAALRPRHACVVCRGAPRGRRIPVGLGGPWRVIVCLIAAKVVWGRRKRASNADRPSSEEQA